MIDRPSDLSVRYVAAGDLTAEERADKHALQIGCFADVPADEIFEYFVAESIGSVLAWSGGRMVGCVSVFVRTITFGRQSVRLGGYGGTCTQPEMRNRGIGAAVCRVAMETLRDHACAIAMLAVGADGRTVPFYERQGFRLLRRPFAIVTAGGRRVVIEDDLAMIAPVADPDLFAAMLGSDETLFLGPDPGYW